MDRTGPASGTNAQCVLIGPVRYNWSILDSSTSLAVSHKSGELDMIRVLDNKIHGYLCNLLGDT